MSRPVRTFIYGSCVSRDTFEFLQPQGFELLGYIARQSLISSFSSVAPWPIPSFETSSDFQERMLVGDWNSSLIPMLKKHAPEIDLLLWDLCDERLGVIELTQTSSRPWEYTHSTRSVDSIRAGIDSQLEKHRHIPFGSTQHRLRFNRAVPRFLAELEDLGLLRRTLVIATPWASKTSTGMTVPTSFGLSSERANRIFTDYYNVIRRHVDLPYVTLPNYLALADGSHKWGLAPFHYWRTAYDHLCRRILVTQKFIQPD